MRFPSRRGAPRRHPSPGYSMKKLLMLCALLTTLSFAAGTVELETIPHRIVAENRTFPRDAEDRRISIWTTDPAMAQTLIREFGIPRDKNFQLRNDQIFAIFLNDRITEDLVQITYNRTAGEIFADYASSGLEFKLRAPEAGKKHSHLTAVVFTPPILPGHLGLRGMVTGGLSEKR
jgi:hypothetical protein